MSNYKDYLTAYTIQRGISLEEAENHKMVQNVNQYYEEQESIIVKDISANERKCDS